jgi:hypothetical protein
MVKEFMEEECEIELQGKKFSSGGAYLGKRIDTGLHEGFFYAYPKEGKVGNWKGDKKVPAYFGTEWISNMGDTRQHVEFTWDGVKLSGTYYKSSGDVVRVKEVKGER